MSPQPTAFQTFYRLTIMLGTLTVGSMAAYRYGPEPDRLAEMIDHVASLVTEVTREAAPQAAEPAALAVAPAAELDSLTAAPALWNEATAAPRYDAAVQPASALVPIPATASPAAASPADGLERLERERLTAPLLAVGATRADVTSWGHGDAVVYRATASASVSTDAAGLERRFDALGDTPDEAVAELVAEIRAAQVR